MTRYWAKRFPNSTFIGYDIDKEYIQKANDKVKEENATNVSYVVQDGCQLPPSWNSKFDMIFCILMVHDVPYVHTFLKEIKRSLKIDGLLILVEARCKSKLEDNIDIPTARETYAYSLFHCLPVSLYHDGSEGVGLTWGVEKVQKALQNVGFTVVHLLECTDIFHPRAYFLCRNSPN